MTNDELRKKYRFLKEVAQEGGRTYHALDSGGRVVMVHYLADVAEPPKLLKQLDRLGIVDRRRILDRYDVDGGPVIVTEFIQGFSTFAAWVQARAPGAAAATAPAGGGAFTNLFGPGTIAGAIHTPAETKPPHPGPPPSAASLDGATQIIAPGDLSQSGAALPHGTQPLRAVTTPAAPPPPSPSTPAGMTQIFGAAETPAQPEARSAAPKPTAAQPPTAPPSGMTQLFGTREETEPPATAPHAPAPPVAPAKPTPPSPVGMTQLFGSREDESAAPPPAPPTPSAPTPAAGAPKPTVHWREAPAETPKTPPVVRLKAEIPKPPTPGAPMRPAPAAPAPSPKPAGEFTRLFGGGEGSSPPSPPQTGPRVQPPIAPPNVSPRAPAADPTPRAPGEFTQLFQSQPKAVPPLPTSPAASDRDYRAALSGTPDNSSVPAFGPPAPSAPPAQPKQAGEFTQLMAGGMLSPTPPPPAAATPARPAPPAAARPAGPGEFTRIVSAPAPPSPQSSAPRPMPAPVRPPAAAPPTEEAQPDRRSRLVLILALGVLGLTAVVFILYVVLRAKS